MSRGQFSSPEPIRFLAEQDGAAEQLLKSALAEPLAAVDGLECAYLVRGQLGSASASVFLALSGRVVDPNSAATMIGDTFAELFRSTEHLDIVFISAEQEAELRLVAKPFLKRD